MATESKSASSKSTIIRKSEVIQPSESESFDIELINLISKHDEKAFAKLHDRFSKQLFLTASSILRNAKEAEDIVQEVFIHIWNNAKSFDSQRGNPLRWALALTRNKSIDRLRLTQRPVRFSTAIRLALHSHGLTEPFKKMGGTTAAMIRSAVKQLPEEQKKVVEMSFVEDMTHEQISKTLETPLGTVKARMRRSMLKLKDQLKKHFSS